MGTTLEFISWLSLGFLLGIRHAFEADHIVAVSALVSEQKNTKPGWRLGALWGLGHSISILALGALVFASKITLPEKFGEKIDTVVGVVLILLGINLWRTLHHEKIHRHEHTHDGSSHIHLHSHKDSSQHEHKHLKRSFWIGSLHGAAGSASLTLLLVTQSKNIVEGLLYLTFFGIGSIISMASISTVLSLPFVWSKKFNNCKKTLQGIAGTLSMIIGLQMVL